MIPAVLANEPGK